MIYYAGTKSQLFDVGKMKIVLLSSLVDIEIECCKDSTHCLVNIPLVGTSALSFDLLQSSGGPVETIFNLQLTLTHT